MLATYFYSQRKNAARVRRTNETNSVNPKVSKFCERQAEPSETLRELDVLHRRITGRRVQNRVILGNRRFKMLIRKETKLMLGSAINLAEVNDAYAKFGFRSLVNEHVIQDKAFM